MSENKSKCVKKFISDTDDEFEVETKIVTNNGYNFWDENQYRITYHKDGGAISIYDTNAEKHIYLYPGQVKVLKQVIDKKFDKLK